MKTKLLSSDKNPSALSAIPDYEIENEPLANRLLPEILQQIQEYKRAPSSGRRRSISNYDKDNQFFAQHQVESRGKDKPPSNLSQFSDSIKEDEEVASSGSQRNISNDKNSDQYYDQAQAESLEEAKSSFNLSQCLRDSEALLREIKTNHQEGEGISNLILEGEKFDGVIWANNMIHSLLNDEIYQEVIYIDGKVVGSGLSSFALTLLLECTNELVRDARAVGCERNLRLDDKKSIQLKPKERLVLPIENPTLSVPALDIHNQLIAEVYDKNTSSNLRLGPNSAMVTQYQAESSYEGEKSLYETDDEETTERCQVRSEPLRNQSRKIGSIGEYLFGTKDKKPSERISSFDDNLETGQNDRPLIQGSRRENRGLESVLPKLPKIEEQKLKTSNDDKKSDIRSQLLSDKLPAPKDNLDESNPNAISSFDDNLKTVPNDRSLIQDSRRENSRPESVLPKLLKIEEQKLKTSNDDKKSDIRSQSLSDKLLAPEYNLYYSNTPLNRKAISNSDYQPQIIRSDLSIGPSYPQKQIISQVIHKKTHEASTQTVTSSRIPKILEKPSKADPLDLEYQKFYIQMATERLEHAKRLHAQYVSFQNYKNNYPTFYSLASKKYAFIYTGIVIGSSLGLWRICRISSPISVACSIVLIGIITMLSYESGSYADHQEIENKEREMQAKWNTGARILAEYIPVDSYLKIQNDKANKFGPANTRVFH